ncbi:MAG: hypothetical protein ACOYBY_15135 [Dermatophilaceae bacterium]
MAIVMVSDAGTDNVAQYDQIIQQLEEAGYGNPPGRLSHTAALKDNGSYFVVDVWESAEALQRFAQLLMPLIEAAGGVAPSHGTTCSALMSSPSTFA